MDPFGIYSSFFDLTSDLMQSPSLLKSETEKLETQFFNSISMFLENRPENNENFEKDILSIVRKNNKILRKNYLFLMNWTEGLINQCSKFDEPEKRRILFWFRQLIFPLLPSNFLWSNPSAVSNLFRSDGESIKKGYLNFLNDMANRKLAELTDKDQFKPGENIATTEGDIVFKNELMELIQYRSITDFNYKIPVVLIQPWINKYYIFDLNKEASLVNFLREKGFTVFITSWKNPGAEHRNITFEDYLFKGILTAIKTANKICSTSKAHVAGYCIGGTALVSLLGTILNDKKTFPVSDISLFATLIDFKSPGEISYFITPKSLNLIRDIVKKDGYLDGEYISYAFRSLKPDSLIWPYFSNNYLTGSAPPTSDLLFWNTDKTNLTEKMCLYFLEEFYLKNKLIKKNALSFNNIPCDISKIDIPIYSVGAEQDHIALFSETIKIFNHISSEIRFILADEGHITGFLNPPFENNRRKYRVIERSNFKKDIHGISPDTGSWWDDWIIWLKKQDPEKVTSRTQGNGIFKPLYKAPGKYVLG